MFYLFFAFSSWLVFAQEETAPPATVPVQLSETTPLRLKFRDADMEMVLADYSEKTGRTLLLAPNLPKVKISLQNQTDLTMEEYLKAIDTVLGMNGIVLLKVDDKFLKVVLNTQARQEEMNIIEGADIAPIKETGELVSHMIPLKHIDPAEAQKAIASFLHPYGKINLFELVNSMLITDTAANINRITQILGYIDQPIEAREEPHVMEIRFSKASEIKKKLEEIIADSQKEPEKSTVPRQKTAGAPGVVTTPTLPGVIRAPKAATPSEEKMPESITEIIEEAERGIIRGKVKIVADDRTNILIIITRPENMSFFEKIIKILDVETEPEVIVKVFRLEYATAETVASTLNTLITKGQKGPEAVKPLPEGKEGEGKGAALREYVEQLGKGGPAEKEISKIGELSAENIKILSDKRTNSLLIMASKADMAAIEEIITNMDMMLPQVLIEAVIIQVALGDAVSSGIHWVQRALIAYNEKSDGSRQAIGAMAGSLGGGSEDMQDASTLTSLGSWGAGSGLTAYFTHFGLGLDAIVKLAATDSRAHILSAPVIVTTDNTKGIITSSEQKYFLKGTTVVSGSDVVRPEVEIKDIGLELEVTPHINVKGNVMMEIVQDVSDPGEEQMIDMGSGSTSWPTIKKRSFTASIAVQNRETIILGGLVRNEKLKKRYKVPILSDIPLLGRLFSYNYDENTRSEVIVFITPYVLTTPDEITEESARRKDSLNIEKGLWKRGWSDSKLTEDDSRADSTTVRQQEKQWEKELENIDKRVEKDMKE